MHRCRGRLIHQSISPRYCSIVCSTYFISTHHITSLLFSSISIYSVASQRAKAGSQTLRLLRAVEAKSLWSCLWLNYKQVTTIKAGRRQCGSTLKSNKAVSAGQVGAKTLPAPSAVQLFKSTWSHDQLYRTVLHDSFAHSSLLALLLFHTSPPSHRIVPSLFTGCY